MNYILIAKTHRELNSADHLCLHDFRYGVTPSHGQHSALGHLEDLFSPKHRNSFLQLLGCCKDVSGL